MAGGRAWLGALLLSFGICACAVDGSRDIENDGDTTMPFQPMNLFRPVAPGLSGAINPLMFIGSGMATGNMAGALGQMGTLQQQGQQIASNQELQRLRVQMLMQQQELKRQQAEAQQAAAEEAAQRRAEMAPQLFPQNQGMQALAQEDPEFMRQAALAGMKTGQPTAGMRQFEAFQGMPEDQQEQFLSYQRAMSPFAGAQAFMSPLGAQAEKWKNEAGESPSPALTAQQATSGGFRPSAKPTEKQQDVAAFVQNAEVAEKMLGDLEGWTPAGTLAARNPISRLLASEQDKRASDFQLAWTMAVLRAESGAVISPAEAEQQIQVYFDQPGDTQQQKADKASLRSTKMESMRQRAGQAYSPLSRGAADTAAAAQDPQVQQIIQSLPPEIRGRIVDIKVTP